MIARALPLLPDERLAQLAAAGSDPAFAVLYDRYSGMLFAYCRSITRNVDDGWDALQNAMVKVLVALRRSPDRNAPLRPWLFCICHNESIGILRRRGVRAQLRTCDGCRAYAASIRRRPLAALTGWSPLAGYELLESVFRAAASGPGGGALAAKAAAVAAVVATGIGAADVATLKPERSSPAPTARSAPTQVAARPKVAAPVV